MVSTSSHLSLSPPGGPCVLLSQWPPCLPEALRRVSLVPLLRHQGPGALHAASGWSVGEPGSAPWCLARPCSQRPPLCLADGGRVCPLLLPDQEERELQEPREAELPAPRQGPGEKQVPGDLATCRAATPCTGLPHSSLEARASLGDGGSGETLSGVPALLCGEESPREGPLPSPSWQVPLLAGAMVPVVRGPVPSESVRDV